MRTSSLFYIVVFSGYYVCMEALEPRVKCTKSENGLLAVSNHLVRLLLHVCKW